MKKVEFDFRYVSDALIALLVCAAVSLLMIWYSLYFKRHYQEAYDYAHSQFRKHSEKYLAVDDEMRIIREKYPRFIELYNKGVVGKENRLNWLETLRASGASIKMPNLQYEIKSQEANNPPYLANVSTGNFQVYGSKMNLQLGLLHEYDLSALLEDLSRRATGLYSVSRCTMTRAGEGAVKMDAKLANINANCELDWYTVNLPGEGLVINPMKAATTQFTYSAHSGVRRACLLLACAAMGVGLLIGTPTLKAEELGRLFLTPAERTELERLRNGIVATPTVVEPPPVVEQPPAVVQGELPPPVGTTGAEHILPEAPPPPMPPITVNGVVLRSNGQGTAWVNGENTYDGDFSAANIQVARPQGRYVNIRTPANLPDVRLQPGQTYNPTSNTIVEPYDHSN